MNTWIGSPKTAATYALTLLGLTAGTLGCDDTGLTQLEGKLVFDELVDFGDVQIGIEKTLYLELTNEGGAVVTVDDVEVDATISGSRYQFEIDDDPFDVRAGDGAQLRIKFRPFEAMDEPADSIVKLVTEAETFEVTLRGRGVASGLIVEPNPVDFGSVLLGSVETLDVQVTNALSESIELFTNVRGGIIDVEVTAGTGMFDVQATAESDGSLGTLDPGASITLPVRYVPSQIGEGRGDRARFQLSNCDFELCEVEVTLIGRGTDSALTCAPESFDFGAINPGRTRTATITCENSANDPIEVQRASLDLLSASEFSVMPISVGTIQRGESFDVAVTFAPTAATLGASVMGTLVVEAANQDGAPLRPSRVTLLGAGGGPAVVVQPDLLNFGIVAVQTTHTKRLLVTNVGYDDLVVSNVEPDVAGTGAFSASRTTFVVAPGNAQIMDVTIEPQVDGMVESTLRLTTNDLSDPTPEVVLVGEGITLPPCAYTVTPPNINFGNVPLSEAPLLGFRVENVGNDVCLMNDVDFVPPQTATPAPFTLVDGPVTSAIMIAPGAFHDVPVQYQPSRIGTDTATVGFYISSVTNSNPVVPLFGVGEPLLEVTCPATVTTAVGTPVSLAVTGRVAGANITGYQWNIVSSPAGGAGTPGQWTPNPPTAATEDFLALIVGVYDIRVDIFDDVGRTASCVTRVNALGEGLVATLRWSGNGDHDLHVHNPATTVPWFTSPDDCYYSNRTPIWDTGFGAGFGPNPELDVDNTSGFGPENTRVSTPVIGQPYTVAVHHYSSAAGTTATVEIYCGGVATPTQVFNSTTFSGSASGNCSANEFWRVATVTFTSASTCIIAPIDTYTPSSQACTTF
ncbi:MAG: choice-of-anchor D domain-containing protein [Deltaproteobacteria bacterium]